MAVEGNSCQPNDRLAHFEKRRLIYVTTFFVVHVLAVTLGVLAVTFDEYRHVHGGGGREDIDARYWAEYEKESATLRQFINSRECATALWYGALLGLGFSVCLAGIWIKKGMPILAIVLSLIFLGVEFVLADMIVALHVYPHH